MMAVTIDVIPSFRESVSPDENVTADVFHYWTAPLSTSSMSPPGPRFVTVNRRGRLIPSAIVWNAVSIC